MDKRWSRSQFKGLPVEFVMFAKRTQSKWKAKHEMLVDHDGDAVAWLVDSDEKTVDGKQVTVALWHPEGIAKLSYKDLQTIQSAETLRQFQGSPLKFNSAVSTMSVNDLLDDTRERLLNTETDLPTVLSQFGTVGTEELFHRKSEDGPLILNEFESISPESAAQQNRRIEDPRSYQKSRKN